MDLLNDTKLLLATHKEPRLEIAQNAGVKFDWLTKFCHGKIGDPGVKKIQKLHDYLKGAA